MESFYSRLKIELIYSMDFCSISELKLSIFEYIEIFYNRQRRNSGLGYVSPGTYEQTLLAASLGGLLFAGNNSTNDE